MTKTPLRFDPDDRERYGMREDSQGNYVKIEDYLALREERDRLAAAIEWALGQRGDFPSRGPDDPPYCWRTKLRTLAFGNGDYAEYQRLLSFRDKP